jgi:hypothetical protein
MENRALRMTLYGGNKRYELHARYSQSLEITLASFSLGAMREGRRRSRVNKRIE